MSRYELKVVKVETIANPNKGKRDYGCYNSQPDERDTIDIQTDHIQAVLTEAEYAAVKRAVLEVK